MKEDVRMGYCDKCEREVPYHTTTLLIGPYNRMMWHCQECYRNYQLRYLLENIEEV